MVWNEVSSRKVPHWVSGFPCPCVLFITFVMQVSQSEKRYGWQAWCSITHLLLHWFQHQPADSSKLCISLSSCPHPPKKGGPWWFSLQCSLWSRRGPQYIQAQPSNAAEIMPAGLRGGSGREMPPSVSCQTVGQFFFSFSTLFFILFYFFDHTTWHVGS